MFLVPITFLVVKYGVWGLIGGKLLAMVIRERYVSNYLKRRGIACAIDIAANAKLLVCGVIPYVILRTLNVEFTSGAAILYLLLGYIASYLSLVYLIMPFNKYERMLFSRISKNE